MSLGSSLALAAAAQASQGDFLRLIAESGALAKLVLLVLLGFSVLSWAVIIERSRALGRAERDSIAFLGDLERDRRLTDLRDRAGRYAHSPLAGIFVAGFRELTTAVTEGVNKFRGSGGIPDEARGRMLYRIRQRLEEAAADENDRLDRYLGILATTASVTPFIGLFGTVVGIMNAFQGIGVSGQASLASVAPGISEALVATAAGLFAAIPAVVGYNFLLARARRLSGRIERFVITFAALAESQIEAGRAPAAVEAGKSRL